jgi:ribosomal 50S subunit-recycling heat shock protein
LKLARLVKRRETAQEMITVGAVRLGGRVVKPAADVKEGDKIAIAFPRRLLEIEVTSSDERVLKRRGQSFKIIEERQLEENVNPWEPAK